MPLSHAARGTYILYVGMDISTYVPMYKCTYIQRCEDCLVCCKNAQMLSFGKIGLYFSFNFFKSLRKEAVRFDMCCQKGSSPAKYKQPPRELSPSKFRKLSDLQKKLMDVLIYFLLHKHSLQKTSSSRG
jgi:hypothetical protein